MCNVVVFLPNWTSWAWHLEESLFFHLFLMLLSKPLSYFDCGIILKYYNENHSHVVVFLPIWTCLPTRWIWCNIHLVMDKKTTSADASMVFFSTTRWISGKVTLEVMKYHLVASWSTLGCASCTSGCHSVILHYFLCYFSEIPPLCDFFSSISDKILRRKSHVVCKFFLSKLNSSQTTRGGDKITRLRLVILSLPLVVC